MKLENNGFVIDDEFPCSIAGEMRSLEPGLVEVEFQPETIPQWFQDMLDDLFGGKGVPKEYMAHVRVRNIGREPRRITLRFLLSPKGAGYTYPSWWIWREDRGWSWLPPEDTDYRTRESLDASVDLRPGESLRIASAPYEEPAAVIEKMRRLAERYDMWNYREIGTTA
jgi:hypothetical protein